MSKKTKSMLKWTMIAVLSNVKKNMIFYSVILAPVKFAKMSLTLNEPI